MYRAAQLYKFLNFCEQSDLKKEILECGAGVSKGMIPTLLRFHQNGYLTQGIELFNDRIKYFKLFCAENNTALSIQKGDMRNLDFDDKSMSFIYSYNSIFHMEKRDIETAINEIKRVLKNGGLCFVNFLSLEDGEFGSGTALGNNEFMQQCKTMGKTIHSFFDDMEADKYFIDMTILSKEKRIVTSNVNQKLNIQGYIDYIVRK